MSHADLSYEFCSLIDQGRVRANNEDAVTLVESLGLAILADGMGGYNAGEVASAMATQLVARQLGDWLAQEGRQAGTRELRRAMDLCVGSVNREIFHASQMNLHYAGMGTTLVIGVFRDDRLVIGHIGDSRAYRLRGGELARITRDHSLMQEQIDAGLITPQQAAVSSQRNLVTRALGVEPSVLLETSELAVEPDDCYLLCSDGLSDMVDDAVIAQLLARPQPLAQRAQDLIAQANANGGRDNIAVVLVQAAGERRGLISRWLGQ